MQRSSAERSSRIFILALVVALGLVMVLYFMKRSELATFQTELILAKNQAVEVEEAFNQKISAFQQQVQTMEQKISNIQDQLNKCEDQLLSSDKDMEKKVVEVTECNKKLESMEDKLKESMADYTAAKATNDNLMSDMTKAKNQLLSAQSALGNCQTCKEELTKCQTTGEQTKSQLSECLVRCPSSHFQADNPNTSNNNNNAYSLNNN